jgi:predicted esterase
VWNVSLRYISTSRIKNSVVLSGPAGRKCDFRNHTSHIALHSGWSYIMRILVLHGFGQNGDLMRAQLGTLSQRLLKQGVSLHFATAPLHASEKAEKRDRMCWWRWDKNGTGKYNLRATHHFRTLSQSQAHVSSIWGDGGFEGLLGFSQGAMLAATLGKDSLPGLRKRILVAGAIPVCSAALSDMRATQDIPTLRVANIHDAMMPVEGVLAALGGDNVGFTACDEEVTRGHVVPESNLFVERMVDFLRWP